MNMEGDLELTQQVNQAMRDVDEHKCDIEETEIAIKSMDLSFFSEESEEVDSLRSLLWEFKDIFLGMGLVKNVEHKIELTPGATPYCAPIRRRSPAQEDAERIEVNKLVALGVMEPAISPWAACNVFVPKKSGALRTTTDFRRLNTVTVTDTYPMEDVRETLDWLARKKIFSTFDLKDGFFQVLLAKESRPLTAVHKGCWLIPIL
jgi:hypothetical protein